MKDPTPAEVFLNRIKAENDWIGTCKRIYHQNTEDHCRYARKVREHTGLSLRGMAKLMGVSAPFLSDLERGNRWWTEAILEKWKEIIHANSPKED